MPGNMGVFATSNRVSTKHQKTEIKWALAWKRRQTVCLNAFCLFHFPCLLITDMRSSSFLSLQAALRYKRFIYMRFVHLQGGRWRVGHSKERQSHGLCV